MWTSQVCSTGASVLVRSCILKAKAVVSGLRCWVRMVILSEHERMCVWMFRSGNAVHEEVEQCK